MYTCVHIRTQVGGGEPGKALARLTVWPLGAALAKAAGQSYSLAGLACRAARKNWRCAALLPRIATIRRLVKRQFNVNRYTVYRLTVHRYNALPIHIYMLICIAIHPLRYTVRRCTKYLPPRYRRRAHAGHTVDRRNARESTHTRGRGGNSLGKALQGYRRGRQMSSTKMRPRRRLNYSTWAA